MELIAQGAGNVASAIFGGIPATGAIARTATNIKSGGKTPISAIIHAVFLLLVLLLIGKWAAMIPMATLAAVLIVVAYNMSEWREFRHLLKSPRGDVAVLLATFLLTVFIELTVAIQAGILLAAFLFLQKMSKEAKVDVITENLRDDEAGAGSVPAPAPDSQDSATPANTEFCAARFSTFSVSGEPGVGNSIEAEEDRPGPKRDRRDKRRNARLRCESAR